MQDTVDHDPDDRLFDLFERALELPRAARAAWLAAELPDEPELRTEVLGMLAAHERQGVLDRPAAPTGVDVERLRTALAGRYAIDRELGRGGMATVFLAEEQKHHRRVVLKVLNPQVASGYGADRFQREVHLAARLAHPHILGLLDSGSAAGLLYYVMPHLEGETLRVRLEQEGALDRAEALTLLEDIASALAHAHAAGVVHRDLKPENVLCVGVHAYLLDFGVARLLDAEGDGGRLTAEGARIGTPAYMAPEQLAGRPADHRVDIYAWGLLAWEMFTGRLPSVREPLPLHRVRSDVPEALGRLVEQCLAPEPGRRPSDAGEVVARLQAIRPAVRAARRRTVAAMVVGALVLGAGVVAGVRALGTDAPPAVVPSAPIVVSPLVNETGDTSLTAIGRMAGDWITQGLQQTDLVPVVPWPTALQAGDRIAAALAAGEAVDPVNELRAETGADIVVTGAYYLVGDSLRFRVEIADARAGRILGAPAPVSAHRSDPAAAIDDLRQRVMGALAVHADDRLANTPGSALRPPTFAAYQVFDRGVQFFVDQRYAEALPEFVHAATVDSTFAVALLYAVTTAINTDDYTGADSLLRELQQRSGLLGEFHRLWLANLEATLAGDGQAALRAVRRASALAPNSRAGYNHAVAALRVGRPEEALTALRAMDPDRGDMRGWSSYWTQLAHAYHLLGRYEEEVAAVRELERRFPERRVALSLLVRPLAVLGRLDAADSAIAAAATLPARTYWSQGAAMVVAAEELLAHGQDAAAAAWLARAVEWFERRIAEDPDYGPYYEWVGNAYYSQGRWVEARRAFAAAARLTPHRAAERLRGAVAAARLGDRTAERALEGGKPWDRGSYILTAARIAVARGEYERAARLFVEAVDMGEGALPWVHGTAARDLRELHNARYTIPGVLLGASVATPRTPSVP